MKLQVNELKQLIRESINDQLAKLKEKSESGKKHQASDLCKILQTQVDALTSVINHSDKIFNETQYSDLNNHKSVLETLRTQKMAKIDEIKAKYQLIDKKKEMPAKKQAPKKKTVPAKKPTEKKK